ncbi:MAG: PHP domain-containing protein [Clostridia bacterium]|nr:PHP domain-containing protein [Clostridia bacterium]
MKFAIDHDSHIHSHLSICSDDPEQSNERILKYAEDNGFRKICLTDHFWDETLPARCGFYNKQGFEHIKKALPLPQSENVQFLFGCETEMDKDFNVGVSEKLYDKFDFIIVPTTHLHFNAFVMEKVLCEPEYRAYLWVKRFEKLLEKDMPFHKMGVAHLTCRLMLAGEWESGERAGEPKYLSVLRLIGDDVYRELFAKAAKKGIGIELNIHPFENMGEEERAEVLRPYRAAKEMGCKFYLGSDAHVPAELDAARKRFEMIIDALDLCESDKFHF